MILAIDPGKRDAGVSLWDDKELAAAWLAKGSEVHAKSYTWPVATAIAIATSLEERVPVCTLQKIVIERPQIYRPEFMKDKDPNDLIDLAIMGGALVGVLLKNCQSAIFYLPKDWKGQAPKVVINERVNKRLSSDEQRRIDWPPRHKQHNVWDALGIGMKAVGRL